ncbi:hypothetical protein AVEN_61264-1 [Araneus ventricosus]|uniref:Uncharacterized protein n=1 Tax=Araneus ventricosus TaxID=182803 RepID=A0A4Y2TEV6_ARAVE|nr:hypothetical protein AVEN_61264-1 [Araneus ventricosus]
MGTADIGSGSSSLGFAAAGGSLALGRTACEETSKWHKILDRYQVSRNLAVYPAFTITLMRCSGGPFAGYFAERFGINEVMILGSLLAAVGISACFFAEDIAAVTVFLGFIHGNNF